MINFTKMHGCGNDFIVINDPEGFLGWNKLAAIAKRYCDRRFGVGADGVIGVGHAPLAGEDWPANAEYEMRYVNSDGSRAEMCGNGIRCLGKFVGDELGVEKGEVHVLTGNGVLPITLHRKAGSVAMVTVGMGIPGLNAGQVPTTVVPGDEQAVSVPLDLGDDELLFTAVSMGNPHAVAFVDNITDDHVLGLGPLVESHSSFPRKTNVEFAQPAGERRLRMRVWERGCGETWACGTGACAVVVAAVMNGKAEPGAEYTVVLNGGELLISWPGEGQHVMMSGPAETVFRGTLEI